MCTLNLSKVNSLGSAIKYNLILGNWWRSRKGKHGPFLAISCTEQVTQSNIFDYVRIGNYDLWHLLVSVP